MGKGLIVKSACILIVLFTVVASASANSIKQVRRVVDITMVNNSGEETVYEIADVSLNGGKGDGVIDFANFIKEIKKPDIGSESQIPPGTKFPLTVKLNYFRPGDELSNPATFNEKVWFGGFHGKVVVCLDADGEEVSPKGGTWKIYSIDEKFMRQLQGFYDKYR